MANFGRFTHLLLNEENVIRHFFLYCLEKCLKGNTWRVQWPIKLPDLWLQLFPLCEHWQDWWFMGGKRSLLHLACCKLLFCTLLTHRGIGSFGAFSQSIWVLQERQGHPQAFEELVWGCKGPISAGQKKAVRCRVPTNQVKPRGQKHDCLSNIKQVSVFLNRSLEIYFQKGVEGTSPCILSCLCTAPTKKKARWGWKALVNLRQNLALRFAEYQFVILTHLWYACNAKQWTSCTKHCHRWKLL